jgi:hypothetical protein
VGKGATAPRPRAAQTVAHVDLLDDERIERAAASFTAMEAML